VYLESLGFDRAILRSTPISLLTLKATFNARKTKSSRDGVPLSGDVLLIRSNLDALSAVTSCVNGVRARPHNDERGSKSRQENRILEAVRSRQCPPQFDQYNENSRDWCPEAHDEEKSASQRTRFKD
jgi:hypothetical protein